MKKKWFATALVMLVVSMSAPVIAQGPPSPPPPPGAPAPPPPPKLDADAFPRGEEGRRAIEQVMIARLSRDLDLNDEQTVLLVRRLSELRDGLHKLRRERNKQLELLAKLAESKSNSEKLEATLDSAMQLETKSSELKLKSFEEVSQDFEAWQRARLYVFMQNFDLDLRRLIEHARNRVMLDEEGPVELKRGGGRERDRGDRSRPGPPPPPGGTPPPPQASDSGTSPHTGE